MGHGSHSYARGDGGSAKAPYGVMKNTRKVAWDEFSVDGDCGASSGGFSTLAAGGGIDECAENMGRRTDGSDSERSNTALGCEGGNGGDDVFNKMVVGQSGDRGNRGRGKRKGIRKFVWRQGDWQCPQCEDFVFSWKHSCSLCGTAKVAAGGGAASSSVFPSAATGGTTVARQGF